MIYKQMGRAKALLMHRLSPKSQQCKLKNIRRFVLCLKI